MRSITHAYPPKPKEANRPAPAGHEKPVVILKARIVKDVDKLKRIARLVSLIGPEARE